MKRMNQHANAYARKGPVSCSWWGAARGAGGTYLTGVDLKNPYQSNPVIDSSRHEVQRSRGRKKRWSL